MQIKANHFKDFAYIDPIAGTKQDSACLRDGEIVIFIDALSIHDYVFLELIDNECRTIFLKWCDEPHFKNGEDIFTHYFSKIKYE